MRQRIPLLLIELLIPAALALVVTYCGGQSNIADCTKGLKPVPCNKRTQEEEARADLQNADYTGAITLLNAAISAAPNDYHMHPLLAAAYAARAGMSILEVAKNQFKASTSGSSGSSSLLDQIGQFVPKPSAADPIPYANRIADMKAAVDVLHAIPAALLANTTSDAYATSAALQLTLYEASYSVMFLDQFAINPTTGKTDVSQLATMTEDQAVAFIATLTEAGQIPQVASGAATQATVTAVLAKINGESGATTKDKIQAFIAQEQAGGGGATPSSSP